MARTATEKKAYETELKKRIDELRSRSPAFYEPKLWKVMGLVAFGGTILNGCSGFSEDGMDVLGIFGGIALFFFGVHRQEQYNQIDMEIKWLMSDLRSLGSDD
ncbi:MAG: hypothetical protein JJU40_05795 [Rhodobacteraceae bacterium]|nr:hypothetical protein [Paracoccaceae bacterium]